jgi:hypothetical protein
MPAVLTGGRLAAAAAIAVAALAGSASAANIFSVNCGNTPAVTINSASATLPMGTSSETVLGLVLGTEGTPASLSQLPQIPVTGDVIEITGLCPQDVDVTVPGLTITNPNYNAATDPTPAFVVADGVTGQLEVSGATGTMISGLLLGATSSFSFGSTKDLALLYAHDGAAVTLANATVAFSPLLGVLAARSSEIAILTSAIASNGGNNADTSPRDNGGVQARDNGTIVLGFAGGTMPVSVTNHAFDAVSAYRNSTIVLYAAQLTNNMGHQVTIVSASSAYITGNNVGAPATPATTILAPAGAPNAVQAYGTSTVRIDTLATITGASGTQAISVNAGSALLLQGSLIAAAGAGPVIEASAGSVLGLAGGNVVCNGTLSGSSCTPDTGFALDATRVSSLVQVNASEFGYAPAAETVVGGGTVQLQSTADLGVGFPNGVPSIGWNAGANGVEVSQNSSFRMEGGVAITGALDLAQGSNGFANLTNNPSGNKTPNSVTSLSCAFSSIPAAHVTASSKTLSPAPVLSTNFQTTVAGQCLSF